jgi:glucan phosphoethanolaminetransferase (alkaline phosphatase superfamily)
MGKIMITRIFKFLFPKEQKQINTLYFIVYFVLVAMMSCSHYYFWGAPLNGSTALLLTHVFGQSFLEAGAFFSVAYLLNKSAPRWIFSGFIAFTFGIFFFHLINFKFIRISDTPVLHNMNYFLGSGLVHFVEDWMGGYLSLLDCLLFIAAIPAAPLVGLFLYRVSQSLSERICKKINVSRLAVKLCLTAMGLVGLDLLFLPSVETSQFYKYQKTLPFGDTLVDPLPVYLSLPKPITQRSEAKIHLDLKQKNFTAKSKPNIYLVVIESLRRDFVNESIAPALATFAKENVALEETYSSANGTCVAWLSIFHSNFAYRWSSMWQNWQGGSVPLRVLKNLGYKTHVFSASVLHAFSMDSFLFGKNNALIDDMKEFGKDLTKTSWQKDAACFDALKASLEKEDGKEGNVYILMLDSTHAGYSFPADKLKFNPIGDFNLFNLDVLQMEPVKNRYRNSIAHVDTLFEGMFDNLKSKGLYDDSIIAITADHGEEFMEEGSLWHGTHLNKYQTNIPIFYKMQKNTWIPQDKSTTQVDIFPSIIHYLTKRTDFNELFDGKSIYSLHRDAYRLTVKDNLSYPSEEFIISNSANSYRFRFTDPKDIYRANKLEVIGTMPPEHEVEAMLAPLLK